jgi:hypothetical protein
MPYFGIPIRNGLPIGLGSVAGFGIAPFEPYSLFENGEQGAWYDPSDFSTLFDDSAGTTPVTGVEQFVGLMLDKSKGLVLGPELVTNGDFSSGTTGWTLYQSTLSAVSGKLRVTAVSGAPGAYQAISIVSGKTYEVTFDIDVGTVGTGSYFVGNTGLGGSYTISASGKQTFRFLSTTTNAAFLFYIHRVSGATAGQYFDLDNVSVKELAGNHATQTLSTKRPKLAARYNLLQRTEEFDNGYWAKVNTTVTANAAVAPNGTTTAELAYPTTSGTDRIVWNGSNVVTIANGLQYVTSIYAKASGKSIVWFGTLAGNTANANCAFFDLQNQTSSAGAYFSSASIVPVGNGWYLCKATATSASTVGYGIYGSADAAGSTSVTANGTDGVLLWGADLRPASQATGLIGPTYQRVVDAATYDTAGFLPYLQFDGLSWSMSTGSIDFTATDKMTVWAGVRKLSEIAGVIAETSSSSQTNNGAFLVSNAFNGSTNYDVQCRGTDRNMRRYVTYAAPITNVLQSSMTTAAADSAAAIQTRINATLNAGFASASAASSGNFGNYPLHLGGRNSAGDFFNGWLTSLIVRGAQSTQSQIEATESWVNGKTGAYV